MKPSEINKIDKHTLYAAQRLKSMWIPGAEPIEPKVEKLIKLKNGQSLVWRFAWDITEKFMKSRSILGMSTPAAYHDIKHQRQYVVDIYRDDHQAIDYIVEKDVRI